MVQIIFVTNKSDNVSSVSLHYVGESKGVHKKNIHVIQMVNQEETFTISSS